MRGASRLLQYNGSNDTKIWLSPETLQIILVVFSVYVGYLIILGIGYLVSILTGRGPSIEDIYNVKAGRVWNILCFPAVCTIGLFIRSLSIFCFPCIDIIFWSFLQPVHRYLLCCVGWPYEDKDFIGAKALGDHSENKAGNPNAEEMELDTDWIRAHKLQQFEGKRPQLFEGEIEPEDLCQGAVGDCWLVAAFASASEFPDAIRNMFVSNKYNPRGLYKVRIFDPLKKKFEVVIVDDRIPCKKGTKTPRFMQPHGNELWAIILEKAYAKFCGSYAKLSGGFVLWGWHSMTGDNVFQMSRNENNTWYREDMVTVDVKEDRRACYFNKTKETYTEENLWSLMKKYDRQKSLMSASIGKQDYRKVAGPNGEQMLDREGLVAGHAYSVIQAREVSKSIVSNVPVVGNVLGQVGDVLAGKKDEKLRFVQLRNPWGTFEWKGDWSDKSPLWKQNPKVAKELHFVDLDDGAFWMTFDDFKHFYTRVNICDRSTVSDMTLDVNEDDGPCGVIHGWCCGCTKFWCLCKGFRNLYCGHDSTNETLDAEERCLDYNLMIV